MDIFVHQQRETTTNSKKVQELSRKVKRKVERRKSSQDRRRSVGDGIVVSLSCSKEERRARFQRRSSPFPSNFAEAQPQSYGSHFVSVRA